LSILVEWSGGRDWKALIKFFPLLRSGAFLAPAEAKASGRRTPYVKKRRNTNTEKKGRVTMHAAKPFGLALDHGLEKRDDLSVAVALDCH